jgi:hypothetical protein
MSRATPSAPQPASLPSPAVRTTVSLLLFMHLFAITVAIVAYPQPSMIETRLKQTLDPYLQPLNFDLSQAVYASGRLQLTHAAPTDVDYAIEVDAKQKDGTKLQPALVIPQPDLWPPQRRRRDQALANATGALIGNEAVADDLEALLPKAIASSVLAANGGTAGAIRVKAHYLLAIESRDSTSAKLSDPFDPSRYSNAFDAQVLVSRGRVDLLKASAAGEAAPVTKGK